MYRPADTIVLAAVCGVAALLIMAAMAVRGPARGGFGVMCAVAGFALAPTSGALTGLRAATITTHGTDSTLLAVAALAGAIAGAGAGFAAGRPAGPSSRDAVASNTATVSLVPAAGLLLAAAALVAGAIAEPFTHPALLGVLTAAVTGGLSMALARSASRITAAGAMTGVIVLAGGTLAGYLAAGALRHRLAGVTALGWWELLAAAAAVAIAFAACARRARRPGNVRTTERSGRAPCSDRGGERVRPVHG
jgi:hypothetical protein